MAKLTKEQKKAHSQEYAFLVGPPGIEPGTNRL